MKGSVYILIKLYLKKQVVGPILPVVYSLLTPDVTL